MAAVLPRHLQLLSWLYFLFFCSLLSRTLSCGSGGSSNSRPVNRNPHYTSHSSLNTLYNKGVKDAQRFSRPVDSSYGKLLDVFGQRHEGVVLTTQDGERWLVHKGRGYGGPGGHTVVVPAEHMSQKWRPVGDAAKVKDGRVGDYVKSGGKNYEVFRDDCRDAADRMMDIDK